MKIGLFGGTFDPPHNGHQQVARELLGKNIVDQIWFVPVFEHPWAERLNKKFAPYEDRVAMLELILEEGMSVKHFKQKSFTYDTLSYFNKLLQQENQNYELSWIMGSEYLPKFADFLDMHPRLLDFHFYIYPRAGYPKAPLYPNMTLLDQMTEIEVSSTQVRELLVQNKSVSKLVDNQVNNYILEHNIYSEK
jgi:nicotinate-nucleotide adenylyltransferase